MITGTGNKCDAAIPMLNAREKKEKESVIKKSHP
jgi:hypothetical protein